jgi:hypothetical protein
LSDPTAIDLLLLCAAGLIAGAVNTVAGAGSLLLLAALIWTGLPADAANATNRIGILAQSAVAVVGFHRAGYRLHRVEGTMLGLVMAGAAGGSFIATLFSATEMEVAIVIAMIAMLLVALLPKRTATPSNQPAEPKGPSSIAGQGEHPGSASFRPLVATGLFVVGLYGGFLQAGVGILLLLFLNHTTEMGLLRANVLKSYAALTLTVSALVVFVSAGEWIDLSRGLAVGAGSAVGAMVGVRATVELGAAFVQRAVTTALVVVLIKMLYDLVA